MSAFELQLKCEIPHAFVAGQTAKIYAQHYLFINYVRLLVSGFLFNIHRSLQSENVLHKESSLIVASKSKLCQ